MSDLAEEVCSDAQERMAQAVAHSLSEFATVRTGRATPALVEKLQVDYYGSKVPLQQLASFAVPEARLLVIQPFDKEALSEIVKAVSNSDLGVNPADDGTVVRLAFPPLTEERRKELVKVVKHMAEDGKVVVRNVRRSARQDLEELEKEKDISSDDKARFEQRLDQATNSSVADLDQALASKEQELLEI